MKRWQFWLGIVISAAFLFWALRKVDFAAAWEAVLTAQWAYLLVAWLCLLASYLVRTWRWRIILRSIREVQLWTLWRVYMSGFMANNILPARIGEVVRAYLLGQTARISAASALGTVAVERVFDVALALLLLTAGAILGLLGGVGNSLWLGSAMVGALLAGILGLAFWGGQLSDLVEKVVGHFSPAWGVRLADAGRSFVQGIRSVGNVGRIARVAFWSAASWALFMLYAYFVLRAYGLHTTLAGLAFLLGMAGLGVSIPSAPGSVGTLEYAYILALQLLGVGDDNTRASFALTYHVLEWVTTCSIGLFCLGQMGLSLGQLSALAQGHRPGSDLASGTTDE
jgi:uncharacterized protein (TIRG00374 family)